MAAAGTAKTHHPGGGSAKRFLALPPLTNKRPETSISNLFSNSLVRNRPLARNSNAFVAENGDLSQSSDASQESREILTSLLQTLKESNIPGPQLIRLRPESNEFCNVVGEGAQCEVLAASSKCEDLLGEQLAERNAIEISETLKGCQLVAVKRTKTVNVEDHTPQPSEDGTRTKGLRDQFEFARRDIMTLCHETFRRHRNIVKLMAWGLDLDTLEDPAGDAPRIPLLVLERANGNLSEYLQFEKLYQKDHTEFSTEQCKLCLDVGRGLEAIHNVNMTHGDLKPSNVLISQSNIGATAKLCDFGLAIEERKGEDAFIDYQGTPGWIPPETFEPLGSASLLLCDLFAYGLIVWCVARLDWESPIEGIPPKRVTERELFQRAWFDIQDARVLRQGQDTNRLLRVLRACLHVSPSLRERQPWSYLDRGRYLLVAPSADPTQNSASLFAFDVAMRFTEQLGSLSTRILQTVHVSWLPMFRTWLHPVWKCYLWLRRTFEQLCTLSLMVGGPIASLWHSKSLPPRQRAYETLFYRSYKGPDPSTHINNLDQIHGETIEVFLDDALRALSTDEPFPEQVSQPLLSFAATPTTIDIVYAAARLRSRLIKNPITGLGASSKNAVHRGFQAAQRLGITPLAWLCRGSYGRSDITGSQYWDIWRVTLEAEMDHRLRLQLIALLLQMGASPQDKISPDSTETVFRRTLQSTSEGGSYQHWHDGSLPALEKAEELKGCILVCKLFRSAAVQSNTHEARFFLTGELPDDRNIDEGGNFTTTALHEAISARCVSAVRYFLSLRFPVYVLDHQGHTPLQVAEALCQDASKNIQLKMQSDEILELIQQSIAITDVNKELRLPLGWTAKQLSSGSYVYYEVHTSSITFKVPKFSLWEERRLTLGFKSLSTLGQRFFVDIVRFVIAKNDSPDNVLVDKDYIFDDAWFLRDIVVTQARAVELPRGVYAAQAAGRLLFQVLVSNYINILLLVIPFILIGALRNWESTVLVILSSVAIVPLYSILCFAVREMAVNIPKTYRIAATAVPDSAIEFVFGIISIAQQDYSTAKSLIIGVVLNNILLVTGICFVISGIRYYESNYYINAASTRGSLLILSMALLFTTYAYTYDMVTISVNVETGLGKISMGVSIVLLVLYVAYSFFRYRSHAALYDDHWVRDYQEESLDEEDLPPTDETSEILAPIPALCFVISSIALIVPFALIVSTQLYLVNSRVKTLYPLFILPVCLKSPLHFIAFRYARLNDMEGALNISMDGALRVLYLLCSLLVILSRVLRQNPPLNLLFDFDQVLMTSLAVLIVSPILRRGKSTFLDGGMLLAICLFVYLEQGIRIFGRGSSDGMSDGISDGIP